MPRAVMPGLLQLPPRKRMEIADRLWASVAVEEEFPLSGEYKRILSQRLADYKSRKSKPITHSELMRRVRASRRASP